VGSGCQKICGANMNDSDFYDELVIPPELLEIIKQEKPIEEDADET
jgi:hypothetical protein